jgi:hypothetical protein
VRDEFESAFGHGGDKGVHDGELKCAGGEDADGAFGGDETFLSDDAAKARFETAEKKDFSTTSFRCGDCGVDTPEGFEGIADGTDSGGTGGAEHRAQDKGEHVHVLVGVNVGEAEAVTLEKGNLRGGFSLDFGGANARGVETFQEVADGGVESAGGAIDEGRDVASFGCRSAVD